MNASTENALVAMSASEMARRIQLGEVSSPELVQAHIERIEQINPAINALVVPLFEEARLAAVVADQARAAGEQVGPLHGVPVTIKEFFDVRGTLTTAGIEPRADQQPVKTDAPLVARLRTAGAIVLGKTNVPQLGIAIESQNPVYGQSLNPWDPERSPGGSSGGEAAVIAAGGSPLGLGSDGGGSIRIPSHCCGVCGLKPTSGRLTMNGHWQFPAFPHGWTQPGPIARSVDDLELALECLIAPDGEPSDPSIAPGKLRPPSEVDISKLTVGFYTSDGFITPSPALKRACEIAVEVLRSAGAQVVEFMPADPFEAWEIEMGQVYADGGKWIRQVLGRSRVDPLIKRTLLSGSLPSLVRRVVPTLLHAVGQKTMASILRLTRNHHLSAYGYQVVLEKQLAFRRAFLKRLDDQQIDVLICPPFASVAMKHSSPDIVLAHGYTMVYNLLGMPAGVVPVTTVQTDEQMPRASGSDVVLRAIRRAETDSAGMPVGVQVVARHWREDVALAVMHLLHTSCSTQPGFPQTPTSVESQ